MNIWTPNPDIETNPAQVAFAEAGGNMPTAIDLLTARVMANPALAGEDYLRAWARSWAAGQVHGLVAGERVAVLALADRFGAALETAMAGEMTRMLDMPLFGGKRIGDATPAEVRESASNYAKMAKDMARKSRWQIAVAEAAERAEAPTIGAALSEETMVQLWEASDA